MMNKETEVQIRKIVHDEIEKALKESRRWFLREFEKGE